MYYRLRSPHPVHIRPRALHPDFRNVLGVTSCIMFAAGSPTGKIAVDGIRTTHCKSQLNIQPQWYPLWLESLIETVREFDKDCDATLANVWRTVMTPAIGRIVSGYDVGL